MKVEIQSWKWNFWKSTSTRERYHPINKLRIHIQLYFIITNYHQKKTITKLREWKFEIVLKISKYRGRYYFMNRLYIPIHYILSSKTQFQSWENQKVEIVVKINKYKGQVLFHQQVTQTHLATLYIYVSPSKAQLQSWGNESLKLLTVVKVNKYKGQVLFHQQVVYIFNYIIYLSIHHHQKHKKLRIKVEIVESWNSC